jgi:hypothetical protein
MPRYRDRVVTDLEGPRVSLAVVFGLVVCTLNVTSVVSMLVMAG